MLSPLQTLRFTEESGIAGAICYLSEDIELTDVHVRLIVEAKSMNEQGEHTGERLDWWDASKYW